MLYPDWASLPMPPAKPVPKISMNSRGGAFLMRAAERVAVGLLATVVLAWVADYALFRLRLAHGQAYESVEVNHFLEVPLKNGHRQYDYVSSDREGCVRALFPHGAVLPCWYLRRHPDRREDV
jgi:hypothetical protein